MAIATESVQGTVLLAGDLAGGVSASSPELTPTGVKPGEYKWASVTVDAKGRVLYASEGRAGTIPLATKDSHGIIRIGKYITSTPGADGRPVISVKKASKTDYGVVLLGNGFDFDDATDTTWLKYPAATVTHRGRVFVPESGHLDITDGVVTVPVGSKDTHGLVTGTANGSITLSGDTLLLNTSFLSYPNATTTTTGVVRVPTANGLSVTDDVVNYDSSAFTTTATGSTSTKGLVQVGSGFAVNSGTISVPAATTTTPGVARGNAEFENTSGVLSYQVVASPSVRGLVKIGSNIGISNGFLNRGAGDATTTTKGLVQIGANGLAMVSGQLVMTTATTSLAGRVRGDATFTHTDGTLSQSTPATTSVRGLVKVGSELSVTSDGTLSYTPREASTSSRGIAQIGSGLTVSNGVVSTDLSLATTTVKGIFRPGYGLTINNGVIELEKAGASGVTAGGVQSGTSMLVFSNGALSFDPTPLVTLTSNHFTRAQGFEPKVVVNTNNTATFDLSTGNHFELTENPTATVTINAPVNIVNGTRYSFLLRRTAASSLTNPTFSFDPAWKLPAGVSSVFTGSGQATRVEAVAVGSSLYVLSID